MHLLGSPVRVDAVVADGRVDHDLVCVACDGAARVHPAEGWVAQVRLFLDLHRHEPVVLP